MTRIEPGVNGRDVYDCSSSVGRLVLPASSCADFWKVPRRFKWVDDELVYKRRFENLLDDAQFRARTGEINFNADLDDEDGVYVNLYKAVVNQGLTEIFESDCYVPDPCDEPAFEMAVVDFPIPEMPPPGADPNTPWVLCPDGSVLVSAVQLVGNSYIRPVEGSQISVRPPDAEEPCTWAFEGDVEFELTIPCPEGYQFISNVTFSVVGEDDLDNPPALSVVVENSDGDSSCSLSSQPGLSISQDPEDPCVYIFDGDVQFDLDLPCPEGYSFVSNLSLTVAEDSLGLLIEGGGSEDITIKQDGEDPCKYILDGTVEFNLTIPCPDGYTVSSDVTVGDGLSGELSLEPSGENGCEFRLTGDLSLSPSGSSTVCVEYNELVEMGYSTTTHKLTYKTRRCETCSDGSVECDEPTEHDITTAKPCPADGGGGSGALYGSVVGDVVEGVEVAVTGPSGFSDAILTDADGDYEFTDLDAGSYTLSFTCGSFGMGGGVEPSSRTVEVGDSGESVADVTSYCSF